MNLKEAFRFQNKLQSMMTDAQSILGNNGNITKVQNTYLRHKVMAEAEDEVTMEAPSTEYSENITEMAEFLLFLLDEREKLSAAIHQAKVSLPLGAGLDGEVSLNGKRQEIATLLRHMAGLRNGEVLISNGGVGYRFNNEGNQVSYRCDVKRVTTINFDRNKIRKMCADLSKKSDETSAALDAALVNTPVEYEAPFDVNETFAEAFEAHMSALGHSLVLCAIAGKFRVVYGHQHIRLLDDPPIGHKLCVGCLLIVYTGKVGAVRQHIEIAFTQLRRPLGSLFLKRGYANKAHILLNLHLFQTPVEG